MFYSRDLPKLTGMFFDDCNECLAKFEACAHVYGRSDADRQKYLELCLSRNALQWYETNKLLQIYSIQKTVFSLRWEKTALTMT